MSNNNVATGIGFIITRIIKTFPGSTVSFQYTGNGPKPGYKVEVQTPKAVGGGSATVRRYLELDHLSMRRPADYFVAVSKDIERELAKGARSVTCGLDLPVPDLSNLTF